MTDSTRRAIRTGLQSTIACLTILGSIVGYLATSGHGDLFGVTPEQLASFSAVIVVVIAGVTKLANVLEEFGLIPEILKSDSTYSTDSGVSTPVDGAEATGDGTGATS